MIVEHTGNILLWETIESYCVKQLIVEHCGKKVQNSKAKAKNGSVLEEVVRATLGLQQVIKLTSFLQKAIDKLSQSNFVTILLMKNGISIKVNVAVWSYALRST